MRLIRWIRARTEPRAAILLYHRVADLDVDPWGLAVTPGNFEVQLDVMRRRGTVLPLEEFIGRVQSGTMPRRAIVVTFDDGYADNLLTARPLLDRYGVPATVFVTTGVLAEPREFWWDEIEGLFLTPGSLPAVLDLEIEGRVHRWDLQDAVVYSDEDASQYRRWGASDTPPTRRHALFIELWRRLQILRDPVRRTALDQLARWAGADGRMRTSHRPMTDSEVRELARGALVSVGAHTVSHSRLSVLSGPEQETELVGSRRALEELLDRPVRTLAYPFGGRKDYTPATVALARKAGFSCACATAPGPVHLFAGLHELPRCVVRDMGGDRFEEMLDRCLEAA